MERGNSNTKSSKEAPGGKIIGRMGEEKDALAGLLLGLLTVKLMNEVVLQERRGEGLHIRYREQLNQTDFMLF